MKNPMMLILLITVVMFALIALFADAHQSDSARFGLAGLAIAAICISSRLVRSKYVGDVMLYGVLASVAAATLLGPVICVWLVNALAISTVLCTVYFSAKELWPNRV